MRRRFIQTDVFSPVPAKGNGLAVVVDAQGLSDAAMQDFAAWTNLAETTFLLPPGHRDADYKVRIFTPERELPFAGHPTLGSCMAWLHAGGRAREAGIVRQECGVGIVDVDVSGAVPAFVAPPTSVEALPARDRDHLCRILEIAPSSVVRSAILANGPVWRVLELESAAAVLAVDPARVAWPEESPVGLIGPHGAGAECAYEVRMLAPSSGMSEDPITGSLNAAIACWMRDDGRLAAPHVVAQGTAIDRVGRVHVTPRGPDVLIGGAVAILIEGTLDF